MQFSLVNGDSRCEQLSAPLFTQNFSNFRCRLSVPSSFQLKSENFATEKQKNPSNNFSSSAAFLPFTYIFSLHFFVRKSGHREGREGKKLCYPMLYVAHRFSTMKNTTRKSSHFAQPHLHRQFILFYHRMQFFTNFAQIFRKFVVITCRGRPLVPLLIDYSISHALIHAPDLNRFTGDDDEKATLRVQMSEAE